MPEYFEEDTLDDLLNKVTKKVLCCGSKLNPSRGQMRELFGVSIVLKNPRARLSRSESRGKVLSALGELLWYLSGESKLEFIQYYLSKYEEESDDGVLVRSGYGDRLFKYNNINQIDNVIETLKRKSSSRRAVVQIFDGSDLAGNYSSIPCTCLFQFAIRNGRLHMITYMRSNDIHLGLPHDIFSFTMIQEIIAKSIGCDIGEYQHFVGSLHLYERNVDAAEQYLSEGFHDQIEMDAMPDSDPWEAIKVVLSFEEKLRVSSCSLNIPEELHEYWKDICRLLVVFKYIKNKKSELLPGCVDTISNDYLKLYVRDKIHSFLSE
ncbi:thymidylate synthase [Oceanospirillum sediminis]|uniref:thymidylate synthase n=1 Tax=Oceanospirillum sediminis TaxID=2760088 RepID=A0A839IN90_9GAMM|nr:thymidylate synthase [Oceanospirillum sediminis]MBB1485756.1 thymidylate synthase [Oceanospirillum sediminis]